MRQISFSELKKGLHFTLKRWQQPNVHESHLQHLYLFQQILAETDDIQVAGDRLLQQSIDLLAEMHEKFAELLRLRFEKQLTAQIIARKLNIAEGTVFNQQGQAIEALANSLLKQELAARRTVQDELKNRLYLPMDDRFIGITKSIRRLYNLSTMSQPPWLISIEGIGGIGKTTLAVALLMELVLTGHYRQIAWISAKQNDFEPLFGAQPSDRLALDQDTLVTNLLEQLRPDLLLAGSGTERWLALKQLLKEAPYFVVVDNLESVIDYQTLLPLLRELANPSRILITSRHSLQAYTDVYCYAVRELSRADTLTFLKQEAAQRGVGALASAADAQLTMIHNVVGGNPLALKLVVGQIGVLPLNQVLDNLKQAKSASTAELYTYIYWQAWHLLEASSRKLLLLMPLVHAGTLAQLEALTQLQTDALSGAIAQLVALSLLQVDGDLENKRYSLHRLTETFLLHEAIQWQTSGESTIHDD